MTQWQPIWKVTIDGVEYTQAILANLTIRTGRNNIYEQPQAGYVNLQLIDLDQAIIPVNINSNISVQVKDTSGVNQFLVAMLLTLALKFVTWVQPCSPKPIQSRRWGR